MPISERERAVKAPVRRCGRSALSIPGEGRVLCSRVVLRALSGQECRILCGIQVVPRYFIALKPLASGLFSSRSRRILDKGECRK